MKLIKRGPYPNRKFVTLINITDKQVIVGALVPSDHTETNITWEDLYSEFKKDFIAESNSEDKLIARKAKNYRAGNSDAKSEFVLNRKLVKNVPTNVDAEQVFEYQGKVIFDIEYGVGSREYSDYSIIEFTSSVSGSPSTWKSTLANTALIKTTNFHRYISQFNTEDELAFIGVPFKKDSLLEVGCIGVNYGIYEPISNVELTQHEVTSGGGFLSEIYGVSAVNENISVNVDQTITVPFNVKWTHQLDFYDVVRGENINDNVTLNLRTDKGYLPKNKISTDNNGNGQFKISALGLDAGDVINVKFGVSSFTNIGEIKITVV